MKVKRWIAALMFIGAIIGQLALAQDGQRPALTGGSNESTNAAPKKTSASFNADLTFNACLGNAERMAASFDESHLDLRGEVHVYFYDSSGRPCYVRQNTRVTEGDLFVFGYYGDKNDPAKFEVEPISCSAENPDGRIRDQFVDVSSQDSKDSGGLEAAIDTPQFFELGKFDCYGKSAQFELKRTSDDTDIAERSISQYERYYATWQVGALWTDLQDRTFLLVDQGAGNVISQDIDDSKGPVYVGSVSIYGFPHYVRSWFGGRYSGRDIINHNEFLDRVGLNFSFGLEDPTETLGIGLSFELVRGVNLTYSRLYQKVDVLDGFSVGDSFTAGTIPTQKSWENDTVIGFAIDGRLIAKFFGAGNN